MEDETDLWNVSRDIHLNPGRAGLVDQPADWPWSSDPGYAHRRQRVAWIRHHTLLSAWQGEFGGSDSARAYRRFVEQGIESPPASPFQHALQGWILGGREFADRPRSPRLSRDEQPEMPHDRRLRGPGISVVWWAVANHYGVDQEALGQRRRNTEIASVAARLANRHTAITLREPASWLGFGRAQSVGIFQAVGFFRVESCPTQSVLPLVGLAAEKAIRDRYNLTRRVDESLTKSKAFRRTIQEIEGQLADWQQEKPKPPPRKKKQ